MNQRLARQHARTRLFVGLSTLGLCFLGLCFSGLCISAVAKQNHQQVASQNEPTRATRQHAQLLVANIAAVQQDLLLLESNVTALDREIAKLIEELSSMQTSTEEPEVEEKPGAKQLKYRPPLARRTNLKTISFVCLEGRVIYVDFDALGARRVEVETTPGFRRQLLSKARGEKPAEIIIAVPGGNFNLQYVYHVDDGDRPVLDNLRALPKPGSPGEKSEQLREDTSEFMASLRKVTPQSTAIQFIVFHDSFLAFRNARTIAWEHGFEVGWFPFAAGRGLILGGGGGGGVQL